MKREIYWQHSVLIRLEPLLGFEQLDHDHDHLEHHDHHQHHHHDHHHHHHRYGENLYWGWSSLPGWIPKGTEAVTSWWESILYFNCNLGKIYFVVLILHCVVNFYLLLSLSLWREAWQHLFYLGNSWFCLPVDPKLWYRTDEAETNEDLHWKHQLKKSDIHVLLNFSQCLSHLKPE